MKITSHYWRVIVLSTKEEEVFDNYVDCVKWMLKVVDIFQDNKMEFFVTEVREYSKTITGQRLNKERRDEE